MNPLKHPILYNMAKHYSEYYNKFTGMNENFRHAYIFENSHFTYDNGTRLLDSEFFGDCLQARTLKYSDCFENNNFKSLVGFRNIGIVLSISRWLILRGSLAKAKNSLQKMLSKNKSGTTIDEIVARHKKGSRNIRRIIEKRTLSNIEIRTLPVVKTYFELTKSNIESKFPLDSWMGLWNRHSLQNEFRQFLLFERNNCLKINTRLSHFLADIDRRCTFCKLIDENSSADETFYHLFFDCMTTKNALNFIKMTLTPDLEGEVNSNDIFWFGKENIPGQYSKHLIIFEIFRFLIWKKKQQRKLPSNQQLLKEMSLMIINIAGSDKKLKRNIFDPDLLARCKQALG